MAIRRPAIIGRTLSTIPGELWGTYRTVPDDLRYGIITSVWLRMCIYLLIIAELNYRIDYGSLSHILNNLYILIGVVVNIWVYSRLLAKKKIGAGYLLLLSLTDIVMSTFSVSLSGGIESRYFVVYYLIVATFATVFTSTRLNLLWVTAVAISYVSVTLLVEPGVSFAEHQEKILIYRLAILYGVAAVVHVIIRLERIRRQQALDRERQAVEREAELHRQRIEISQTIHDTTAQTAYMITLGIEAAIEHADQEDQQQLTRLQATASMSRAAMWELRHPIDAGHLFQGKSFTDVLQNHLTSFTSITSVPAQFFAAGQEPRLSTIGSSLLFAIAHNALTNASRHSNATEVLVSLHYNPDNLVLSIADNGIGLPEDYEERGNGFRNMRQDAARMGGHIRITSSPDVVGTTLTCTVPSDTIVEDRYK